MNKPRLLDQIYSPRDLDKLSAAEIRQLAQEIREFLVESVSKTGGHLASNLGTVELTLAIHRVFHSPWDKILWDVGHQSYTHKILTGRKDRFDTLRKEGGLSGFPRSTESVHDAFIGGHSSNSISAGYGIAKAMELKNDPHHVVSIIGDGSFTGGMAYEALNNAGRSKVNFVVVLNHNEMSISKNVGSFAKYLSSIRTKQSYHDLKKNVEHTLHRIPVGGEAMIRTLVRSKSLLKKWIYNTTFFEELGFEYLGPIDGHNYEELVSVLETAKNMHCPVVVNVDTTKGKGYPFAEQNPGAYHGVGTFNAATGILDQPVQENFSTVFGKQLARLGRQDSRICAVTAAMKYGTGLQYFSSEHRSRFFDVGIAEQHAVTFSAGLASQGLLPVFAVYSSFLQRGYDQIIHDCAIEEQHVVLAVDRAGIVGDDGETHQGIFDTAYLSSIPNVTLYAPESYSELELLLHQALYHTKGVAAVRYPRGTEWATHDLICHSYQDYLHRDAGGEVLAVVYGRITQQVMEAAARLNKQGKRVSVLKLLKLSPLPLEAVKAALGYRQVYFFEEGIKQGGIGEHFLVSLYEQGFEGRCSITAIDGQFVPASSIPSALERYGLSAQRMEQTILAGQSNQ